MASPGKPRDRANEANHILRAELQRQHKCIKCERPSRTQRCKRCSRKVESATNRYKGTAQKGRIPRVVEDIKDLTCAMEAITIAHKALLSISEHPDLSARDRRLALAEPLAQVNLGQRFLGEVLERNGFERIEIDEEPV